MHVPIVQARLGRAACAVVTTLAAVAVAVAVLPTAASASVYHEGVSGYDTQPSKRAVATCSPGEVVYGAGGEVVDGNGEVALVSVTPDPTLSTVTAAGLARTGHNGKWAVRAFAVCRDVPDGYGPKRATSNDASGVASCQAGRRVTGTGFAVVAPSDSTLLTAVVPSDDLTSVRAVVSNGTAVAYAICVVVGSLGAFHVDGYVVSSGPPDHSSPKVVATPAVPDHALLTGVGGRVQGVAPGVFIDALVPGSQGRARVRATNPQAGVNRAAARTDDGDGWSLLGYGVDAYYY
jgi:hypothetical protein